MFASLEAGRIYPLFSDANNDAEFGSASVADAKAHDFAFDKIGVCTYLGDILQREFTMTAKASSNQIAFRYRATDSANGVTRDTAKRLAAHLGVDETQAIHLALHALVTQLLPQYPADDGPLTATQVRQIRKRVPQGAKRSVRSSLFDPELP